MNLILQMSMVRTLYDDVTTVVRVNDRESRGFGGNNRRSSVISSQSAIK